MDRAASFGDRALKAHTLALSHQSDMIIEPLTKAAQAALGAIEQRLDSSAPLDEWLVPDVAALHLQHVDAVNAKPSHADNTGNLLISGIECWLRHPLLSSVRRQGPDSTLCAG
jgi:hypothetical protein